MKKLNQKSLIEKFLNIRVSIFFFKEAAHVIRQGHSLKDKLILFFYYLKTPVFFLKSIFQNKSIRDIEDQYKKLPAEVTLQNAYGKFLCGRNMLAVYIIDDWYQKEFIPFLNMEDEIFIDVGAHIGKYSIQLAKKIGNKGKVIAIEPEKFNFSLLKKNIQLNELENVFLVNKAMYSTKAVLPFFVSTENGEGEHSILRKPHCYHEQNVEADTLDNIVEELKIKNVGLIKIDVEGAEYAVLEGALNILKNHHPKMIIEIWNEESLVKVLEYLSPLNYSAPQRIDSINYFFK